MNTNDPVEDEYKMTNFQLREEGSRLVSKLTGDNDKEGLVSSAFLIQWISVLGFFSIFSCFFFSPSSAYMLCCQNQSSDYLL